MSPTRKDYMNGKITFDEYYEAIVKTAGIALAPDSLLVRRTRSALAAGDVHLNTIPLNVWDNYAASATPNLSRAFKAHGDFYSLAGGVCVFKTAARIAAMKGEL